jgi:hypothetical protein
MERRFGHDFSSVRIHVRDPGTAGLAPDAAACTVGTDIVIAPGVYTPATGSGRTLLAHELAHVVQQSGRPGQGGALSADLAERQAVAAGNAVGAGALVPALGTVVARTPGPRVS